MAKPSSAWKRAHIITSSSSHHKVQADFTEGRLTVKIDPSGNLLSSFIDLNNLALSRFSPQERGCIGDAYLPGE